MQGKVFQENTLLERLTQTSPKLIIGLDLPIAVFFFALYLHNKPLEIWAGAGLFLLGITLWTLAEYGLHRYVFHWVNDHPAVQRFHYFAHGFHHAYPRDKDHLFMPPPVNLALIAFFWGMFYLLMGVAGHACMAGFLVGYLVYTMMHYAMHTVTKPARFLRPLWRHHHLHHGKHGDKAFGVSNRFWDWVFGTLPPARQTKEISCEVS